MQSSTMRSAASTASSGPSTLTFRRAWWKVLTVIRHRLRTLTALGTRHPIIATWTIRRDACCSELLLETVSYLGALLIGSVRLAMIRRLTGEEARTAPKYPPPGPENSISVATPPSDVKNPVQTSAVGSGSCRPSTGLRQRQYCSGIPSPSRSPGTSTGSGMANLLSVILLFCGRDHTIGKSLLQGQLLHVILDASVWFSQ